MSLPERLPPKARAISEAITGAVAAAVAADAHEYRSAVERLAALDHEQVRVVLGGVVRSLLEAVYPGDPDGDDLAETLGTTYRGAAGWWPDTDPNALLVLLAGALGSHDLDEEQPAITPPAMASNAPLLTAALLVKLGAPLGPFLTDSLAEIARAETVELP